MHRFNLEQTDRSESDRHSNSGKGICSSLADMPFGSGILLVNNLMAKGDDTRRMILDTTAGMFNQRGYFGASMTDILRATGLQKGGVYNHFRSKEELALEAFDHACSLVRERFADALRDKPNAVDRLLAMLSVCRCNMEDPPVAGGCPIMNTAVESDDAHPALHQRAIKAMDDWRNLIIRTVNRGIEKGEVKPSVDPDNLATILIATVEGALMLAKLYKDAVHLERVTDSLTRYIESEVRAR
jgi:TetR/AcrR family transcriptional repressor of nem operon